jgi:serine/threonine protein kinase
MPYNDYNIIELIGEGSFCKVYKARNKYTKEEYALKIVSAVDEHCPISKK